MLVNHASQIGRKLVEFGSPLSDTFLIETLSICLAGFPKGFGSEEKSDVSSVEAFLAYREPWAGLFVRVIEVNKRNVHPLSDVAKEMVVEAAHFATFILAFPKELFFCIFESPAVEQLLVLIRSLPHLGLDLHLLERQTILFRQLLKLDVIELVIIEELAEDDVEVGLLLQGLGSSVLGLKEGKEVIGELGSLEVEQLKVLVALTHHKDQI